MITYLWIAIGSALGGMGRYALSGLVANAFGQTFPWGTLVINVTGSFVIGFFANQGGHVRDDMPALIAAEQASRGEAGLLVRFDGSAIDDPALVLIILDQATSVGD